MAPNSVVRAFGWAALGSLILLSGVADVRHGFAPQAVFAQETRLERMTLERLEAILQSQSDELEGEDGQWQVTMGEQVMLVLTNLEADRMRLVMPIKPASELSVGEVQSMMLANFHSALDARYAVSNGMVVSVFVHPLSTLQERDARSAILQVSNLVENFGGTYASSAVGFGGAAEAESSQPELQEI